MDGPARVPCSFQRWSGHPAGAPRQQQPSHCQARYIHVHTPSTQVLYQHDDGDVVVVCVGVECFVCVDVPGVPRLVLPPVHLPPADPDLHSQSRGGARQGMCVHGYLGMEMVGAEGHIMPSCLPSRMLKTKLHLGEESIRRSIRAVLFKQAAARQRESEGGVGNGGCASRQPQCSHAVPAERLCAAAALRGMRRRRWALAGRQPCSLRSREHKVGTDQGGACRGRQAHRRKHALVQRSPACQTAAQLGCSASAGAHGPPATDVGHRSGAQACMCVCCSAGLPLRRSHRKSALQIHRCIAERPSRDTCRQQAEQRLGGQCREGSAC